MGSDHCLQFLDLHPFVRQAVFDRLRGTIFGGALGDAIGLYTEFLSRDLSLASYPEGIFRLVEPATDLRNDGHRNKFTKTGWTDDTDHALLIILSYLHTDGQSFHHGDFAIRLRFWCEQGLRCLDRMPFGLGKTVGRVVFDERFLKDPIAAAYHHWKTANCSSAANGSLMRTYPLGIICLGREVDETFQIAADFCRVTHADPRCMVACCLVTGLVRGLLRGEVLCEGDIDETAAESLAWAENWVGSESQSQGRPRDDLTASSMITYVPIDVGEFNRYVWAESFEELELDDAMRMGYVYKTMGAAILALRMAMRQKDSLKASDNKFEELITTLILYGGDADTNAAVAGSLLGAFLGYKALPWHWTHGLMHGQWLFEKCNALASVCGIASFTSYHGSEDPDTRIDGGKCPLTKEELNERERVFMDEYMRRTMQKTGGRKREMKWLGAFFGS